MAEVGKLDLLPDDTQLWIYGFSRTLGEHEKGLIDGRLGRFIEEWVSHGDPVRGGYEILLDRFVIVAGRCDSGVSGCSIDDGFGHFKFLRDSHDLDGLDRDLVFFRNESGEIEALGRRVFQEAITAGMVGPDTAVFDLTLQTLGELRAGRFERRFADSWHASVFSSSV
ncbi:MAG: hypothetical protein ACE5EO_07060 [Candidatus Krumholzibacteriia bacterium]